ncbi:MAG: hypothetical protein IIW65_07975 [Alistipes sp.]|nr:hypothetical protein [Alistipes sp.]
MNKRKSGIFAQIKRFIFAAAVLVGIMFLGGDGYIFTRICVSSCCFLFAWGCWKSWADVREFGQEEEEDNDKW